MLEQTIRFSKWAPNIAVKLPATAAGLDVIEECIANGIAINAPVSFTTARLLAVAERGERGKARALANGQQPGRCFITMMIGRLDDYLSDVAHDSCVEVSEPDIRQSGLAVVKRSYQIFRERGNEALIVVVALRGVHHMTELAGARVVMSIHPANQAKILQPGMVREQRIDVDIAPDVIERLRQFPEIVRAYEPDGLRPSEFITFGPTQRSISQFIEAGWRQLETVRIA